MKEGFIINKILVSQTNENKAILKVEEYNIQEEAFIGRNGITDCKKEGDGKTPRGIFEFGIAFGMHERKDINLSKDITYIKITDKLYWVDDSNSKYYNQLVDITKVNKDWKSAEHLIKYPKEYEYAIEIKTNPKNIKQNGSAIFLHCSTNKPTAGCVSINNEALLRILEKVDRNTKICIK